MRVSFMPFETGSFSGAFAVMQASCSWVKTSAYFAFFDRQESSARSRAMHWEKGAEAILFGTVNAIVIA